MGDCNASNYTGKGTDYRKYRSGYSEKVLDLLITHIGLSQKNSIVADIGAGTGIFSKQLADRGLSVLSIEPNDDMRTNGEEYTSSYPNIKWRKGTGEYTDLENLSVDWVTMASAFHWTNPEKSIPEFHRILKKNGYTTLLWNPLIKEGDEIQENVESIIKKNIPNLSREFRSGENSRELLLSGGYFIDIIEIRHEHKFIMPIENYLNAWKAANHVRTVAEETGEGIFENILEEIRELLKGKKTIEVPYLTKSWTARKK